MLKPAIILGTHVMGLAVIRSLGKMGVPIITIVDDGIDDFGHVSKYVTERITVHLSEDCEEEYVERLLKLAVRFNGSCLIPTTDDTLSVISRHKSQLLKFYIVACTEWGITRQFLNKKYTYSLAESIQVPAPKTMVPNSIEDLEKFHELIQYPCLIKPCTSHIYFEHFKRKMVLAENFKQLLAAYQEAANLKIETLLQEYIPGKDDQGVNYNSYFFNGEPLVEFTAKKVRNAPPKLGSPRVVISKHIPEVIEYGRKILKAMGFYGFSCTEFKFDQRDGGYKLMEVNGRHNRSGLLAVQCGINFPWIEYHHLLYGKLPSECDYQDDIYWIDIYRDISFSLRYLLKEDLSIADYLRPYRKKHIDAIWDLADPLPFIKRGINLVRRSF